MQKSYQTRLLSDAASLQERPASVAAENTIAIIPAKKSKRFAILLSLFSLYIIWGSTYLAMRIGLDGFPPFYLAGIRFLVAGGLLYAFLRLRGAPRPGRAQWLGAGLIGVLLLVGGNGGVVFAEQWVATGLSSVGIAAVPLWTAVFIGLLGRWPSRLEWWGLGLGFIGVLLLNVGGSAWANPLGAIALILAPISWALGTALSNRVSLPDGWMSSAVQMLVGGIVLMIVGFVLRERLPNFSALPAVGAEIYLIIFGSLIAFCAYGYLLRHVRPALATSYAYINPLVAVGLGVVVNGERLSPLGVLAMLVILTGVGLVTLGKEHAA